LIANDKAAGAVENNICNHLRSDCKTLEAVQSLESVYEAKAIISSVLLGLQGELT
jgi:hypothetical protein